MKKTGIFVLVIALFLIIVASQYKHYMPFGVLWDISPVNETEAIFNYSQNHFWKVSNKIGLFHSDKKRMMWKTTLPENIIRSAQFYSDEEIVTLRYSTKESKYKSLQGVVAYSIGNGKELWRSEMIRYYHDKQYENTSIWSPNFTTFSDRKYLYEHFCGGMDESGNRYFYLLAIDKTTGKTVWKYQYESVSGNGIDHYEMSENHIILLNNRTEMIILNKENGKQIFETQGSVFCLNGIFYENSFWYINNSDFYQYNLKTQTNHLIKKEAITGLFPLAFGIHNNNIIIFDGFMDYSLIELNKESGEINWELHIAKKDNFMFDTNTTHSFPTTLLCDNSTNLLPLVLRNYTDKEVLLYEVDLNKVEVSLKKEIPYENNVFSLYYINGRNYIIFRLFNGRIGHINEGKINIVDLPLDMIPGYHPSYTKEGNIWLFNQSRDFFPTKNWVILDEDTLEIKSTGNEKRFVEGFEDISDIF